MRRHSKSLLDLEAAVAFGRALGIVRDFGNQQMVTFKRLSFLPMDFPLRNSHR